MAGDKNHPPEMDPPAPGETDCIDKNHWPPRNIVVKPGEVYRHTCTTCGEVMALGSTVVRRWEPKL